MGRSEGFDEKHAIDVNELALKLFDEFQDLHRMGNTERIWLETAALLHDAGKPQNKGIHHKLARNMIEDFSDLAILHIYADKYQNKNVDYKILKIFKLDESERWQVIDSTWVDTTNNVVSGLIGE